MKLSMFKRIAPALIAVAVGLALFGAVACQPGNRLKKDNVAQVAEGMSKKQVESILGPPDSIDNKDFILMKKTTYIYRQGKDSVTIVFKDDRLQSKESTLTE